MPIDPTPPGRVLVVDDDPATRQSLQDLLGLGGYPTAGAATSAEARRLAETEEPALAILDLVLPDGDGIRLVTDLRASWPGMPTLIVTGYHPRASGGGRRLRAVPGRQERGCEWLDVVLNMAVSHLAARETHARLSDLTERNLGVCPALVAVIPRDDAVGAAVMRQEAMTLIFPYARGQHGPWPPSRSR